MTEAKRARDPEGRFSLVPPPGWSAAPDEDEGGMEVWREDGAGSLHLISFDADEFPDPAEELYAFLEEAGVEIEEDDVDDVELEEGELALCEYEAEEEESEDGDGPQTTFWMQGVATAPGVLVFVSYECPAGLQDPERELVRQSLATLRLTAVD